MKMTRREAIQVAGVAGAGVLLEGAAPADTPAEKPLRFVHLTDMHVPMDGIRGEGFASTLAQVAKLDPAPSFIITGGDHVMETLKCTREKAIAQWEVYRRTLEAGTKLKVYPVLGNHDIWGWANPDKALEGHASYGKKLGLDNLGLAQPFYTFDVGAWHFVVLDSQVRRDDKHAYYAELDPLQLEWLKADLAAVKKGRHICVLSHIPILAACVFFDGDRLRPDSWHVPDAWMHRDAVQLQELLRTHGVKLAISGHIHLHDVVEYNGVTYICDGAVCGNWWKGPYHETPAGFGLFDLYPDGRIQHQYVELEWHPIKA